MKKLFILYLLVICTILSACTGKTDQYDTSSQQNESTQSTQSVQQTQRLPTSAVKTDVDGLYRFIAGLDDNSEMVNIDISDDVLRIEYITPGLDLCSIKVVLYSLNEDKKLGEVMLGEGLWITGSLKSGDFYAVDNESFEVFFYDRNGKQTFYRQISGVERAANYVKISDDGQYLLYNRLLDGKLALYNFTNDRAEQLGNVNGFIDDIEYHDGCFFIRNSCNILKIAAKEKTIETIYRGDYFMMASSQNVISDLSGHLIFTPIYDVENSVMTKLDSINENFISINDSIVVTFENETAENAIRVYDFTDKTITTGLSLTGLIQEITFYNDDILFIVTVDDKKVNFYLYDLAEATHKQIDITSVDYNLYYDHEIPIWEGSSEVINLAQQILDEHGVRVLFGKDDFDISNYGFEIQDIDDATILPKLNALRELLEYFPKGMFRELSYNREVWVYFTGSISYTDTTNFVGAFATQIGKIPFIVTDTSYTDEVFKEIIAHETSHLIDRLAGGWLDGWLALMPEDIANSYHNTYDKYDNEYTPYGSGEVWFYDSYSRTFPTEDRAVIFQKMYISSIEGKMTDEFKRYENLHKKAAFYSEMMRDIFVCCKNADTLPWEKFFISK